MSSKRVWYVNPDWAFGDQREIWETIPDASHGHRVALVDNEDDADIIVRAINHYFERGGGGTLETLLPDGTYAKLNGGTP